VRTCRQSRRSGWRDFLDFLEADPTCGCLLVAVLILGLVGLVTLVRNSVATRGFRPVVSEVYQQVDHCDSASRTASISMQGKALVWDTESDALSKAYWKLPEELRAGVSDSQITVFLILEKQRELVGRYTFAAAYRQYARICVIHWPEKEVVGVTTIASLDPPEKRQLQFTSEYGDLNIPIGEWIQNLSASK